MTLAVIEKVGKGAWWTIKKLPLIIGVGAIVGGAFYGGYKVHEYLTQPAGVSQLIPRLKGSIPSLQLPGILGAPTELPTQTVLLPDGKNEIDIQPREPIKLTYSDLFSRTDTIPPIKFDALGPQGDKLDGPSLINQDSYFFPLGETSYFNPFIMVMDGGIKGTLVTLQGIYDYLSGKNDTPLPVTTRWYSYPNLTGRTIELTQLVDEEGKQVQKSVVFTPDPIGDAGLEGVILQQESIIPLDKIEQKGQTTYYIKFDMETIMQAPVQAGHDPVDYFPNCKRMAEDAASQLVCILMYYNHLAADGMPSSYTLRLNVDVSQERDLVLPVDIRFSQPTTVVPKFTGSFLGFMTDPNNKINLLVTKVDTTSYRFIKAPDGSLQTVNLYDDTLHANAMACLADQWWELQNPWLPSQVDTINNACPKLPPVELENDIPASWASHASDTFTGKGIPWLQGPDGKQVNYTNTPYWFGTLQQFVIDNTIENIKSSAELVLAGMNEQAKNLCAGIIGPNDPSSPGYLEYQRGTQEFAQQGTQVETAFSCEGTDKRVLNLYVQKELIPYLQSWAETHPNAEIQLNDIKQYVLTTPNP